MDDVAYAAAMQWLKRAYEDPKKTIVTVLCIHGQSIFRGHNCEDAIEYKRTYKSEDLVASHGLTGITFGHAGEARNEQ